MQFTNVYNLPNSIEDALTKDTYDLSQVKNIVSVTSLIDSPKIVQLRKRHWNEMEEDISDRIWLLLGSAVHAILERVESKDRFIEERFYVDTDTWELVDKKHLKSDKFYIAGKPDIYDSSVLAIQDYKVTSVWSIIYGKSEWEYQLNCYAWFYRKLGITVEKLQIIAILRDWNRREVMNSSEYPKIPIAVVEVPLWSFDKQDKYIKDRYKKHQLFINEVDDEIPECSEKERWHKPGAFAVYKNDNKKALRVFETNKEAKDYHHAMQLGAQIGGHSDTYSIVERASSDTRCQFYCSCNIFCNYYKQKYGNKK